MRRMMLVALAALLIAAAPPRVTVPGGEIEGHAEPDGSALMFEGIPFAAPPLGERRWRPPAPVQDWEGVRRGDTPAPACLQNDYGWNRAWHIRSSEDCLTLDIRTPALSGRRPVMVWIHGGSNRAGGSSDMVRSRITDQGVVLVAVQYRLGILGFLTHRGFAAEQRGTSGNYGLMDQIAALKWVRENIARFGGDPDNVTIFGESAGAQDVGLLLAAPAARGLFQKAILQSGTPGFGLAFRPLDHALRLGDQLDALLDTGGDVGKLRYASAAALLAADLKLHDEAIESDDYMWLRTTIDGAVLPDDPRRLLAEAPARPVIIGSNRAELALPGGRPHRDALVDRTFGANAGKARALYGLDRPDPAPDPRLGDRDLTIATDIIFRCPAGRLAELLAKAGSPVWRYEFDLAPGGARTTHAAEIPYVMNDIRFGPGVSLQPYWVDFVKSGRPAPQGLPAWPAFDAAARRHMLFDARGVTQQAQLRAEICSLMDRI